MNCKRLALLGGHAARGIAKLGKLTPARVDLMALLVDQPLCQRDIATKLCVSEGVVSRLVVALMKRGLVQREIPVADERFRIVSLTEIGRIEFQGMATVDWTLEPAGKYDCQSVGESIWLYDWEKPLERAGLAFLALLSAQDDEEGFTGVEPPYAAMRKHHRLGVYRDPFSTLDGAMWPDWAYTTSLPKAPPLHEGLRPDPVSVRLARHATIIRTHRPDLPKQAY